MTDREHRAAMATRDLVSATMTLSELPAEQVKIEREDIEFVLHRLIKLLTRVEEMA